MQLQDKVTIITGGSRGIGRMLAERFLREGARVIITSRTKADLNQAKKELGVEIFPGDVSQKKFATALIDFCLRRFGKLDILINNAAILGPIGAFLETDIEECRPILEINLWGMAYLMKKAIPIMQKSKRGKIINFTGGGSVSPYMSFYGVSKAGVIRLTESISQEIKNINIDINIIAPGPTKTKMAEAIIKKGIEPESHFNSSLRKIGDMAVFLASRKSNGLSGKMFSAQHDSIEMILAHKKEVMSSDLLTTRRILPEDRGYEW